MGQPMPIIVQEAYSKHNLLQPAFSDYENEFEKELYMAINLVRTDPKLYGVEAVRLAKTLPFAKSLKKDDLVNYLKNCTPL